MVGKVGVKTDISNAYNTAIHLRRIMTTKTILAISFIISLNFCKNKSNDSNSSDSDTQAVDNNHGHKKPGNTDFGSRRSGFALEGKKLACTATKEGKTFSLETTPSTNPNPLPKFMVDGKASNVQIAKAGIYTVGLNDSVVYAGYSASNPKNLEIKIYEDKVFRIFSEIIPDIGPDQGSQSGAKGTCLEKK